MYFFLSSTRTDLIEEEMLIALHRQSILAVLGMRKSKIRLDEFAPPELIDESNQRKIALIERCLPVDSVIDFGGMWEVDGLFSRVCRKGFRIPRVTMVDTFESENWKSDPSLRRDIDFQRGDFSDERFMATVRGPYDLALAYDVLMHQINLRYTLELMLSKTRKFFLVSQPVLPEELMPFRNCAILLSGSKEQGLIPFHEEWTREVDYWKNFSDATIIDHEHWLWGTTPSLIESLMAGFGWKLIHKEFWRGWLRKSSKWMLCGLVFQRTQGDKEPSHKKQASAN